MGMMTGTPRRANSAGCYEKQSTLWGTTVKATDVRLRRPVVNDEFLKVTEDHLTIAGTKSAALTFAAIEWKAAYQGSGDTKPFEFSVADIIQWQGVLSQSDRTIRTALAHLLKIGVLLRCGRVRDNRFSVQIQWKNVHSRFGKNAEAPGKIAEPGSAKLPNPPLIRTGLKNNQEPNPGLGPLEANIRSLLEASHIVLRDSWEAGGTIPNLVKAMSHAEAAGLQWLGKQLQELRAGKNKPYSWGAIVARCRTYMERVPSPVLLEASPPPVRPELETLAQVQTLSKRWKSCPTSRKPVIPEAKRPNDCHKAAQR